MSLKTTSDTVSKRRAIGQRAIIYFSPQILSKEKIVAGAVVRLETGECFARVAISEKHIVHAFNSAGEELYAIAKHLCDSLLEHVQAGKAFKDWIAPFAGAEIGKIAKAEAATMSNLLDTGLRQNAMFYTLLEHVKLSEQKADSIVINIKKIITDNKQTEHLSKRFHHELILKEDTRPLKVEFLGANFACYFIKLSPTIAGLNHSVPRAHGKLFELKSVKNHFSSPQNHNIFPEEQPHHFELLVVGERKYVEHRQAYDQIEYLADQQSMRVRPFDNAAQAAQHLFNQERQVA
jgi:hypothetical protein